MNPRFRLFTKHKDTKAQRHEGISHEHGAVNTHFAPLCLWVTHRRIATTASPTTASARLRSRLTSDNVKPTAAGNAKAWNNSAYAPSVTPADATFANFERISTKAAVTNDTMTSIEMSAQYVSISRRECAKHSSAVRRTNVLSRSRKMDMS